MGEDREIRDVYYTVPATGVYQAGEGRGLIRRRYTAGARLPMAVALQFGMPGAAEREPTPGGELPEESTQVDPANSDAGETHADNVAGTGGVNSTDTPPVNSTDTDPFEENPNLTGQSDVRDADGNVILRARGFDTGDLPPDDDEPS